LNYVRLSPEQSINYYTSLLLRSRTHKIGGSQIGHDVSVMLR
jgi:hypothetical protein